MDEIKSNPYEKGCVVVLFCGFCDFLRLNRSGEFTLKSESMDEFILCHIVLFVANDGTAFRVI